LGGGANTEKKGGGGVGILVFSGRSGERRRGSHSEKWLKALGGSTVAEQASGTGRKKFTFGGDLHGGGGQRSEYKGLRNVTRQLGHSLCWVYDATKGARERKWSQEEKEVAREAEESGMLHKSVNNVWQHGRLGRAAIWEKGVTRKSFCFSGRLRSGKKNSKPMQMRLGTSSHRKLPLATGEKWLKKL